MAGAVQGQAITDVYFPATQLAERLKGERLPDIRSSLCGHTRAAVDGSVYGADQGESGPCPAGETRLDGGGRSGNRPVEHGAVYSAFSRRHGADYRRSWRCGELLSQFYNAQSQGCAQDYGERVVGLSLWELRRIPLITGVAATASKVLQLCGAVRGGFLDALITDEAAARGVLEIVEQDSSAGENRGGKPAMTWTSRERLVAAIEHREPDRVPININPVLDFYLALKDYLGLDFDEEVKPSYMFEVTPDPRVLAALGVDMTAVKLASPRGPRPGRPAGAPADGDLMFNDWGVGLRRIDQPGGGSYMEPVYHPLANATLDDLEKYPWPNPYAPGRGEGAEKEAKRLYEDTDLAVVGRFGGPIVETALYMMGFENWLIRVKKDPEFAEALLTKITDIAMALDRTGIEATGKYLQIFKISGDDFGMQTGPLYSPKTFRAMFLPHLRRRWAAAREQLDQVNPRIQILFHSCGGIRPIIPDLIDIGLQILDPVQPRAAGMDSAELKQEFGDRITFHGGVDEQHVLPLGSEEDVVEEVQLRLRSFGPGGGYILAPSHYIQADTSPANIVAMCRASQTYGQYPLRV